MRQDTTRERIERLMAELGRAARSEGTVYFTGGVSAVLLGWREMTLDVDLKAEPEPAGFFEALPRVKDALNINIELAAPDQFIPALPGWKERSPSIAREGLVTFRHYDFYAQALAKIERDHARDRTDVARMLADNLVERARLRELFSAIEPQLIRFPAVDAASLRKRVLGIASKNV